MTSFGVKVGQQNEEVDTYLDRVAAILRHDKTSSSSEVNLQRVSPCISKARKNCVSENVHIKVKFICF